MGEWASLLLAAAAGGFVAGALALVVGGLGVLLSLQRTVSDLGRRIENEIKVRAGERGQEVKQELTRGARRDLGALQKFVAPNDPEAQAIADWAERQRLMRGERG